MDCHICWSLLLIFKLILLLYIVFKFTLGITQGGSFEAKIVNNRLFLKLDTLEFALKVIFF